MNVVEGLNVINDPKCNKVLNVITCCPKCNKVLNVITCCPEWNKVLNVIIFCPKCNKLLSYGNCSNKRRIWGFTKRCVAYSRKYGTKRYCYGFKRRILEEKN